jgi:hypothetical protein
MVASAITNTTNTAHNIRVNIVSSSFYERLPEHQDLACWPGPDDSILGTWLRSTAFGCAQWYNIAAVEPRAIEVRLADIQAGVDAVDVSAHNKRLVVQEP